MLKVKEVPINIQNKLGVGEGSYRGMLQKIGV